jgi:hypothetical protein
MKGIRDHVRANVVGYVAVFLALTGTAGALSGINRVGSGDIRRGAVRSSDIHDHAVGTDEIRDRAVTNPKLADEAVDSIVVADNSLTGEDINERTLNLNPCRRGEVLGFARVRAGSSQGGFDATPLTYTSDDRYITDTYNCAGGPVEVRRKFDRSSQNLDDFPYDYAVRFGGKNPASVANVTPNYPHVSIDPPTVSVYQAGERPSPPDRGAFVVTQGDTRGNRANFPFWIVVY